MGRLERLTPEELETALGRLRERIRPELLVSGLNDEAPEGDGTCRTCHDAGYLRFDRPVGDVQFGKMIPCPACEPRRRADRSAAAAKRISRDCGLSAEQQRLTLESFEVYPGNGDAWKAAGEFLETGLAAGQWLTIAGPPGTGKTHILAAIGNAAIARGVAVIYGYVPDLLDHLRQGMRRKGDEGEDGYGDFDERWERVRGVSLLLLDDLGTQANTAWVRERMEALVDYRYREHLALAATTNLEAGSVAAMSERVLDRLERYEPGRVVVNRALPYRVFKAQRRQAGARATTYGN